MDVSVERVHKRHTPGRRAIAHKLDSEQAGQRADVAVGGADTDWVRLVLTMLTNFQIRYYMFNVAYLPLE